MKKIKKIMSIFLSIVLSVICLSCCYKNNDEPVTLTMWHVYGEQATSPMDVLVDEFNSTVGKQEGIVVNVTATSNSTEIGDVLLDSQFKKSGAKKMPDLFFCHAGNAVSLGIENLVNWRDYFSDDELSEYVPDFLDEGTIDGKLVVFPVSKSTHMLFINGSMFDRFSKDTGVTYEQLSTWDGFFDVAGKFYKWSKGKPFCAIDYFLRAVDLAYLSDSPSRKLYSDDGWYDPDNAVFKRKLDIFISSLVKGNICVSDLYSNTQVMTGETAGGISSSAAILYYNDTVTYPDNSSEPMNLVVLPLPANKGGVPCNTQAGTGLCAYKTTDEKAKAANIFAKWLTESERNLKFATDTGYMPVKKDAFDKVLDFEFKNEDYKKLYEAMSKMIIDYKFVEESSNKNYHPRAHNFYEELRKHQENWRERYANGEDINILVNECWAVFKNVK